MVINCASSILFNNIKEHACKAVEHRASRDNHTYEHFEKVEIFYMKGCAYQTWLKVGKKSQIK